MATSYISRTQSANGSGKLTISVWLKHCEAAEQLVVTSYYSGDYYGDLRFLSDGTISFQDYRNSYIFQLRTTAKFLDPASWYHVVVNFDNTLASPTGKIYVNGVLQALATTNQYSQNETSSFLTDYTLNIATYNSGSNWNGLMADLYYIQGQVYEASTFGSLNSTSGEWKPNTSPTIDYSSTGNNSFHMKFEDASNLDLDSGDNTLTFSTTGSPTQTLDCPSNNFCTMNLLDNFYTVNSFANGNDTVITSSSGYSGAVATLGMSSGKYYFEFKPISKTGDNDEYGVGITGEPIVSVNQPSWKMATGYEYVGQTGNVVNNDNQTSFGNTYTAGDIIGVAVDVTNNKLYFSKNGVWQNSGDPTSGATGTGAFSLTAASSTTTGAYIPTCSFAANSASATMAFNFGNGYFQTSAVSSAGTGASTPGTFEYDVPTGYQPLTTKGLNV